MTTLSLSAISNFFAKVHEDYAKSWQRFKNNIIILIFLMQLEKPRAFAPRGRVVLTPSGEIALTLCVEINMTPEKQTFFRGFL